jgi:hypothetical protein
MLEFIKKTDEQEVLIPVKKLNAKDRFYNLNAATRPAILMSKVLDVDSNKYITICNLQIVCGGLMILQKLTRTEMIEVINPKIVEMLKFLNKDINIYPTLTYIKGRITPKIIYEVLDVDLSADLEHVRIYEQILKVNNKVIEHIKNYLKEKEKNR